MYKQGLFNSIKESAQQLNVCLQDNRGLISPDAFSELDSIMSDLLVQLNDFEIK
jgi:hypothetical protein